MKALVALFSVAVVLLLIVPPVTGTGGHITRLSTGSIDLTDAAGIAVGSDGSV